MVILCVSLYAKEIDLFSVEIKTINSRGKHSSFRVLREMTTDQLLIWNYRIFKKYQVRNEKPSTSSNNQIERHFQKQNTAVAYY